MPRKDQCTIDIELSCDFLGIDGLEAKVIADYTYYPARSGGMEYPGDPAYVTIDRVALQFGGTVPVILTSYNDEEIERQCLNHAEA